MSRFRKLFEAVRRFDECTEADVAGVVVLFAAVFGLLCMTSGL